MDEDAASVSFVPADARLTVRRLQQSAVVALDPGAYWLSITPRPPFCAGSARLGAGQDTLREQLVFAPGTSATLEVALTKQCGTINLLTTSGGKNLPFSNFLLLSSGTPQDPGGVITGSSDANGKASIGPITPGRYLIWAWSSNGDGYIAPELSGAANLASELAVAAGQTTSLAISPMRGGGYR